MGRLVKHPHIADTGVAKSTLLPGGITADRPNTAEPGQIRFNASSSVIEYWNGTAWKNLSTSGTIPIIDDVFIGDGVTTAFTMSLPVNTATDILVFVGGLYQNPNLAYSVDGSTTLTFNDPVPTGITAIVLHGYNTVI